MQTILHRSGDQFAIVTVAETEDEFRTQFVASLNAAAIESTGGSDPEERELMINGWFKPAIEVICKMRGYKAEVVERRTLVAGHIDPDAPIFSSGDLTAPVVAATE